MIYIATSGKLSFKIVIASKRIYRPKSRVSVSGCVSLVQIRFIAKKIYQEI